LNFFGWICKYTFLWDGCFFYYFLGSDLYSLLVYVKLTNQVSSILTSLAVNITSMTKTYCCVYSTRLLMMDSRSVRNM
jgi:hypothetical protein